MLNLLLKVKYRVFQSYVFDCLCYLEYSSKWMTIDGHIVGAFGIVVR